MSRRADVDFWISADANADANIRNIPTLYTSSHKKFYAHFLHITDMYVHATIKV